MPPRLAAPVLTVDAGKMHQIDPRNSENLHSMWTVFNRCAEAMEEGRRLENLSWRIWNRETFCCDNRKPDVAHIDGARLQPQHQYSSRDLPQLSNSVDSIASDDIESRMARSRQQQSPPMAIKRLSSSRSSLSGLAGSAREKHISSFALERMVISIKEQKNPKDALPAHVVKAIPAAATSAPAAVTTGPHHANTTSPSTTSVPVDAETSPSRRCNETRSSRSSDSTAPLSVVSSRGSCRMDSDTSADSMLLPQHVVVRGFTPGLSSSYRGSPKTAPIPARSLANDTTSKKGGFILGGSKSSGEDGSSLDTRMGSGKLMPGKSSLTNQLRKAPYVPKKTTSFNEAVETRAIGDEDPFESTDEEDGDAIEDDDGDSDAIEEDDEEEGDWEDSASESDDDGDKPPVFKRIDSTANLRSRRSLLTTLMHEEDRATAMQNMATRLPASKSQPTLQHHGRTRESAPPRQQEERTAPKMIPTSPSPTAGALAMSPRTTRRNMLAAELTESLRTHLLHERSIKNQVLTASRRGIIRRHTAQGNLSQLREYPKAGARSLTSDDGEDEDEDEAWQQGVFGQGALGEYHERGW